MNLVIATNFERLKEMVKGKSILVIPIVSSIDRKTREYNLEADGNINRIVTTFAYCNNMESLKFVLPKKRKFVPNDIIDKFANEYYKNTFFSVHYSNNFGIHAGEQRMKKEVYEGLYNELKNDFNQYDYIFVESQGLAKLMIERSDLGNKMIFWNYTCEFVKGDGYDGPEKSRSFLKGYDKYNKYIMENVNMTILASPEQVEYYRANFGNDFIAYNTIYIPVFIDRNLKVFEQYLEKTPEIEKLLTDLKSNEDKLKYVYLPYRLTDEGYQIGDVINYVNYLAKNWKNKSICILYGDPNNSGYMDKIKDKFNKSVSFKQVPTDRNTYYALIDDEDLSVIIPYFEDIAYINHASIQEFVNDKAKCLIVVEPHEKLDKWNSDLPYGLDFCPRVLHWAGIFNEQNNKNIFNE